jgi:hypothetical protein
MAAISLFWYTNMAAVTSDENDLYQKNVHPFKFKSAITLNIFYLCMPSDIFDFLQSDWLQQRAAFYDILTAVTE